MKKANGIARIYIVIIAVILIIIGAIVVAFILKKPQVNIDKNEEIPVAQKENKEIDNNNNKSTNDIEKEEQNVEELIFNEDFLSSGKIYGNVKFDNSYTDNEIVLSISGIAHNNINETNFVSTKNRWYKTIDLTKFKTLEFYARNGGTGDIMICIDDTIVKRIRYTKNRFLQAESNLAFQNDLKKNDETVIYFNSYARNGLPISRQSLLR